MSKQYGLIIPNKERKHTIGQITARPSIFEEDSDSDAPAVQKPTGFAKSKKQDTISQSKAIAEDPTVYQYDEIYDEMDQKRKESKLSRKDLDKKPKYIGKLLQTAEKRKRENERRIERQVQKEREAEGEEFKDKESFVTLSYKKKLEEMRALEEEEKREEYLESIGDVRKQGNLDGFYRHLYDQKVNYEDSIKKETKDVKIEDNDDDTIKEKISNDTDSDSDSEKSDISDNNKNKETKMKKASSNIRKERKYRSQKDSEDNMNECEEKLEVKKEHLPSNLDADSDFSIDSSSDEDKEGDNQKVVKEQNQDKKETTSIAEAKGNVFSDNAALVKVSTDDTDVQVNGDVVETEEPKPKKPKIDIWKKRTVGEVFDAALKRYFERKALRESLQG